MSDANRQYFDRCPPRRGNILALTVDSTARAYDLTAVSLPDKYVSNECDYVWLALAADSVNVFFYFDSATGSSLSDTSAISAGSALAFNDAYAAILPAGQTYLFRIKRTTDKFLQVKAASTSGILRVWVSSSTSP